MVNSTEILSTIEKTFREESGRVLATLIGVFGDFELAEEAMQEAFVVALEHWSQTEIPQNPGAWITRGSTQSDRSAAAQPHAGAQG